MIIQDTISNYEKVIKYHQDTNYDPKLDLIWLNNLKDILKIIKDSNSAEDAMDMIDKTFMYAINFPPENAQDSGVWKVAGDNPRIRDKAVDWLLKDQKKRGLDISTLPENIQESKYIHERNKVSRNGRILSSNFLRTLSIYDRIKNVLPKKPKILELGSGAGHQARTIMLFHDCKYFIIDIPETLCFSYIHSRLCFPEKKIIFITSPEQLEKVEEFDMVFIPAVFSKFLTGEFDMFINTASMGEMRNDVISWWMHLIQNKLKINYLFTLNRYLNTVFTNTYYRFHCNRCSLSYDSNWDIMHWEIEPSYAKCPFIDTLHARYVEIIAKRPSGLTKQEKETRSDKLLNEVLDEDWVRLGQMYQAGVMTSRDNILAIDTGMDGALFKLWESIRLYPNKANLNWILNYLPRLLRSGNVIFEEMPAYQEELNKFRE